MRLIDADALKEEVNKKGVVGRFNTLLLIDNAPTVEQTIITEFKGCDNCELERPKGEWISLTPPDMRTDTNDYFRMCDKCKHAARFVSADFPYKFCPNCGAKMQKGASDEP